MSADRLPLVAADERNDVGCFTSFSTCRYGTFGSFDLTKLRAEFGHEFLNCLYAGCLFKCSLLSSEAKWDIIWNNQLITRFSYLELETATGEEGEPDQRIRRSCQRYESEIRTDIKACITVMWGAICWATAQNPRETLLSAACIRRTCLNGSLRDCLDGGPRGDVWSGMLGLQSPFELLGGLEYLHEDRQSPRILHRDVKCLKCFTGWEFGEPKQEVMISGFFMKYGSTSLQDSEQSEFRFFADPIICKGSFEEDENQVMNIPWQKKCLLLDPDSRPTMSEDCSASLQLLPQIIKSKMGDFPGK
nr:Receptor-like serine/threonine-protein kinase NCRK [Ipomoea batatas]